MAFKIMFDNLTKEDTVLKPDRGGMPREELIQEYEDRMGYIDEAIAQMHVKTDFRPATKKRLQERGNKAKNILRQEIARLKNKKKKKKKKKKKNFDTVGKFTEEERAFILGPESSFNVDPESLQKGGRKTRRRRKKKGKRNTKRRRKTKRKRNKKKRKTKRR